MAGILPGVRDIRRVRWGILINGRAR